MELQLDAPISTEHTAGSPANEEEVASLQAAILEKLNYHVGKRRSIATERDWLMATAIALRDRVVDRWLSGIDTAYQRGEKRVYYLSLEFLIGRLLFDNLNNLGMTETIRAALAGLDVDLDKLRTLEPDAALGNGGLGRLAACYMESMATLGIPAHGYGIRYDNGLFRQVMKNGWQQEFPEDWLSFGNPWVAVSNRCRCRKRRCAASGTPRKQCSPSPSIRHRSAGAAAALTPCACGRPGRRIRCGWMRSIMVITPGPWPSV